MSDSRPLNVCFQQEKEVVRSDKHSEQRRLLRSILRGEGSLGQRLARIREFSKGVRTSEYHLTSACNLRCQGCWFFQYEFDSRTSDLISAEAWRMLAKSHADSRSITSALLIGGEPTLYPERIAAFVQNMEYVTISSNGLLALPKSGFEHVAIALTLFGGEGRDDQLRAIKPNGQRFQGLFSKVLANYRYDDRATFVVAADPATPELVRPTICRIRDNGNLATFNYYSAYGSNNALRTEHQQALLEELLQVREEFPETVLNTAYSIATLATGRTHWAQFGYDVCPSISTDHPAHLERLQNGHPSLPSFNSYASDGRSLNFCCASGECEGCRDSQAVYSWLLLSMKQFLSSSRSFEVWLDTVESYWRQFRWSPYHPSESAVGPL